MLTASQIFTKMCSIVDGRALLTRHLFYQNTLSWNFSRCDGTLQKLGVAPGPPSRTSKESLASLRKPIYTHDQRILNTNNQGESFEFPANAADFGDADCEAAFEGLGNLEDVTCSRGSVDAFGGATYDIGEYNKFSRAAIWVFGFWLFQQN